MPENIARILEDFVFEKRKIVNKIGCRCYIQDKPCHNMKQNELNCYFCRCPYYNLEGNPCIIIGNKGKIIFDKNKNKNVLDCSNCTLNHTKEFVEKYLKSH